MIIQCVRKNCEHKICMFRYPVIYDHVATLYGFPTESFIKSKGTFSWSINTNEYNGLYGIWCVGLFTVI